MHDQGHAIRAVALAVAGRIVIGAADQSGRHFWRIGDQMPSLRLIASAFAVSVAHLTFTLVAIRPIHKVLWHQFMPPLAMRLPSGMR